MHACLIQSVLIQKKNFAAVNTSILLGFSDYVFCLTFSKKGQPNNQNKVADTIKRGEKKKSAHLTYKLMIPAREFILNIK